MRPEAVAAGSRTPLGSQAWKFTCNVSPGTKFDPWLVLLALGLVVFGLVVLRSATLLSGTAVNRQLLIQGVYAVGLAADAGAHLRRLPGSGRWPPHLRRNGRPSWGSSWWWGPTSTGPSAGSPSAPSPFQPSELAKVAPLICLAPSGPPGEGRRSACATLPALAAHRRRPGGPDLPPAGPGDVAGLAGDLVRDRLRRRGLLALAGRLLLVPVTGLPPGVAR